MKSKTQQHQHNPKRCPGNWLLEQIGGVKVSYGFLVMCALFLGLAFIATFDFSPPMTPLAIDEVAKHDIAADRSFSFVNTDATRRKKESIRMAAPLVCDLNLEGIAAMTGNINAILEEIAAARGPEEMEALRQSISNSLSEELPPKTFETLASPEVRRTITETVIPWVETRMEEGIISDTRLLLSHKGGIIIRNLETDEESVRSDVYSILGVKEMEADMALIVRSLPISLQAKKAVNVLFSGHIQSTLTPNYEATASRVADTLSRVEPVVRKVRKGEVIVRQGETVSPAQYLELQALWDRQVDRFQHTKFIGIFIISLLLSSGLFFSPTAKKGSPITQKDIIFVASMVTVFALLAKGFALLGQSMAAYNPDVIAGSAAYAVPVAGAAGLAALIISTKRYFSLSLLLSFFCTAMTDGGLGIFLFYFLSAMLATWLMSRSQSRQEAVWAALPLLLGLYAMWAGVTFMQGGLHTRYFGESMAVLIGALLSMLLTFALAPVVEMVFRYTTRFWLMELLNLDHPLMRELMLKAPGTYHHSLIVSNMVEAGAKAIGAHGLLCRVGALYHDIGKLDKPAYFIENQFNMENPHDRLTPTLSALVITSHVKRGVDMAQQHHLGADVTAIIQQHHGNGVIKYFYQKALSENPNSKTEDFSYSGPRPQTREAALVMLADVVEASSRTLADPTPSRIKTHIHNIIRGILADGLLEEADLTFRDLDKIAENFNIILNGIFHHRVEYPDKVPHKPGQENKEQAGGQQAKKEGETPKTTPAQWLPADKTRQQMEKGGQPKPHEPKKETQGKAAGA